MVIEDKDRYDDYTELLVQRDQLQKEAGSYLVSYTIEFGEQICANFELKIQCIKVKKSISYCRRRLNRGLSVDASKMEEEIDHEMKVYYLQLNEMQTDYDHAKEARTVDGVSVMRAKRIYRRLAKLLHPDINEKTEQNDELMNLWNRIVDAYRSTDAQKLEELEVLAKRKLEELGEEGFEKDYSDLEERIERVERQIDNILNTEPYTKLFKVGASVVSARRSGCTVNCVSRNRKKKGGPYGQRNETKIKTFIPASDHDGADRRDARTYDRRSVKRTRQVRGDRAEEEHLP